MTKEDYVSFEVAKLLKEKGFDEECIGAYSETNHTITKFEPNVKNSEVGPLMYSAPTHQMAMKWLREKYNIFIEIHASRTENNFYRYTIIHTPIPLDDIRSTPEYFYTYEEAVESALKYVLENLI